MQGLVGSMIQLRLTSSAHLLRSGIYLSVHEKYISCHVIPLLSSDAAGVGYFPGSLRVDHHTAHQVRLHCTQSDPDQPSPLLGFQPWTGKRISCHLFTQIRASLEC